MDRRKEPVLWERRDCAGGDRYCR